MPNEKLILAQAAAEDAEREPVTPPATPPHVHEATRGDITGRVGDLQPVVDELVSRMSAPVPLSTLEQAVREALTELEAKYPSSLDLELHTQHFNGGVRFAVEKLREKLESLAPVVAAAGPTPTWQTEIQAERDRQDAQWGGPEHDDTHSMHDWLTFIGRQVGLARRVDSRGRLVKIAALAVAAMESQARKPLPAPCSGANER